MPARVFFIFSFNSSQTGRVAHVSARAHFFLHPMQFIMHTFPSVASNTSKRFISDAGRASRYPPWTPRIDFRNPPLRSPIIMRLTYFCESFWLSAISLISLGAPFWCRAMSASILNPYLPFVEIFIWNRRKPYSRHSANILSAGRCCPPQSFGFGKFFARLIRLSGSRKRGAFSALSFCFLVECGEYLPIPIQPLKNC